MLYVCTFLQIKNLGEDSTMNGNKQNTEAIKAWDEYSSAFNKLSDKMTDKDIEIIHLKNVVNSLEKYMDLCREICPSKL